MKKKTNWKKILKIAGTTIAAIALVIIVVVVAHKIEGHMRAGELSKYEVWKSATVSEVAEYCDIDLDKVNKVKLYFKNPREKGIGYLTDNYDYTSVFYYIYDTEEINNLIARIKDVKLYGVDEDEFEYYEETTNNWVVTLYVDDKEYALTLDGSSINGSSKAEEIAVGVIHKEVPVIREEYPNTGVCLWGGTSLAYNEELHEYVYDMYERCIKDITVEDIMNVYDEGNYEKFLGYENDGGKGRTYEEQIADGLHVLRYTLRIADFDGYVLVEKQNESVEKGQGKNKEILVYTDVLGVKIYNNEGEYIDFINSTRAEVEEFLK